MEGDCTCIGMETSLTQLSITLLGVYGMTSAHCPHITR